MEKEYVFPVSGMTCAACVGHVERAAMRVSGVTSAEASLITSTVRVCTDLEIREEKLKEKLGRALREAGYGIAEIEPDRKKAEEQERKKHKAEVSSLIWSSIFTLLLMTVSMGHMVGIPLPPFLDAEVDLRNSLWFAVAQMILTLPVILLNFRFFSRGFRALIGRAPNMDSLIAVGSAASFLYGIAAIVCIAVGLESGDHALVHSFLHDLYFESAAMILTLVSIGKHLESSAKRNAAGAVRDLMALRPETATILRDGKEVTIPLEEVEVGDIAVVREGEIIPIDGVVALGEGAVDESALTGESIPVEKGEGASVTGATLLTGGYLHVRAERIGADTALSRIIRLLEDATASKAPVARMADRISAVFVPAVIGISLLTFLLWMLIDGNVGNAVRSAVSVLVISCPCSLGLATPTAIMVGTARGAKNGILIKSAVTLEALHAVDTVLLDKTGTLTEGRPTVREILPIGGRERREVLCLAASAEALSTHPLAKAVVEAAADEEIALLPVENYRSQIGRGISAEYDGNTILVGKKDLLAAENRAGEEFRQGEEHLRSLEEKGMTAVLVAYGGELIGAIGIADALKSDSPEAIRALSQMGIESVMLTGDNEKTAEAVAREAGISSVYASLLPEDKEAVIRKMTEEGRTTAMIGDGINDAPALARADIGIAIGAGTDVAIDSADVVLSRSSLRDAVTAIALSRATITNIKENLFWALFYNSIGIPIAAGVLAPLGVTMSPMIAAACMSLSSLFVVTNAIRLRYVNLDRLKTSKKHHKQNKNNESEESIMFGRNKETVEKVIAVEGMMCGHCTAHVEKALSAIKGVKEAKASLENKSVTVVCAAKVSDDELRSAITAAGYKVV